MNKIKKIMCLFLSLLMILSMGIPTFAIDKAKADNTSTNETQSTATDTNNPLKIEISTNKAEYKVTNVAEITATVTNTGKEDIKNVSAEAVFNDLSPVSKKKSETKKEVETLKSGESISFTYKATLNKNEHKLNIFQKILLWFVRLFNGGYTPSDNGFDNGRDCIDKTDTLTFGKFEAVNTVRVWFGENEYFSEIDKQNELENIEQLNNGNLPNIGYSDFGVPEWLDGNYYNNTISNEKEAINSLNNIRNLMNIKNVDEEFKCRLSTNVLNTTDIYKLQQYHNGLRVRGAELTISVNADNKIANSLNGIYIPYKYFDTTINITDNQAEKIVNDELNKEKVIFSELIFSKFNDKYIPTYLFMTSAVNEYYISAIDGTIIDKNARSISQTIKSSGIDNNGNNRIFSCEKISDEVYYLADFNKGIEICDANKTNVYLDNGYRHEDGTITFDIFYKPDFAEWGGWFNKLETVKNNKNEWKNKSAVTLMANLNDVYDYYYENIGISGFNNNNGDIIAVFNCYLDGDTTNAKSNSMHNCNTTVLRFGYNNNINLDIVAHEYTHSVLGYIVDLPYNGESGAINEAYADIMGEIIQNDCNWTHGDRVIPNPQINGYPDYYMGENWIDTNSSYDDGGVHDNSTVISHAVYLMNENGIQKNDLAKILYQSMYFLDENSDFNSCRDSFVKSAKKLNYNHEIISIIQSSFNNVGIYGKYEKNTSISGFVKDKDTNKNISNVKVSFENVDNSIRISTKTNEKGEFSTYIPDGTYSILLENDYYSSNEKFTVNVVSNSTTIILNPFYMTRKTGEVTGTVKDHIDYKLLPNITVEAFNKEDDETKPIATATTDENGSYTLNLPYGKYSLVFNGDEFEQKSIDIECFSETVNIEPVLLNPLNYDFKFTGFVKDKDERTSISDVLVEVYNEDNSTLVTSTTTNEIGYYAVYLKHGSYNIKFSKDGYATQILERSYVGGEHAMVPSGDVWLEKAERPITASGNCGANGDNVKWVLYDDGELVINGKGAMPNYSVDKATPWHSYRDKIKTVTIKNSRIFLSAAR